MLVGLGILLIMGGAVLAFAINAAVEGAELVTIGWILMAGGALALVAAAVRGAGWMSMGNKQYRTERHVSPDGKHVEQETHIK